MRSPSKSIPVVSNRAGSMDGQEWEEKWACSNFWATCSQHGWELGVLYQGGHPLAKHPVPMLKRKASLSYNPPWMASPQSLLKVNKVVPFVLFIFIYQLGFPDWQLNMAGGDGSCQLPNNQPGVKCCFQRFHSVECQFHLAICQTQNSKIWTEPGTHPLWGSDICFKKLILVSLNQLMGAHMKRMFKAAIQLRSCLLKCSKNHKQRCWQT